MTNRLTDSIDTAVDQLIDTLGTTLVVAMPLGLGKPTELINALYARACADSRIQLTILTALSLEIPKPVQAVEKALLTPFLERVFEGVPELDYMQALRDGTLPSNVEICEFFFKPGSLLKNAHAQQHYISSNYTHAARDVFNQGCNVAAQTVSRRDYPDGSTRYSLSCNPDTGPELLDLLRDSGRPFMAVAQVNQELPYMVHDAEVEASEFDLIIDHPDYTTPLFSTPKMPVGLTDYAIGLHASTLLKDGGTLQVGIGALGDAVVHATILRHTQNAAYRQLVEASGITQHNGALIDAIGGLTPFEKGLYGATEMLVDGFMHLYQAGILKRRVYDLWALQQLVDEDAIDPNALTPALLDELARVGLEMLREKDFARLQHHGVFRDDCAYKTGYISTPDGNKVLATLADASCRAQLASCIGTQLRGGIIAHGGFFLGPNDFYQALKDLPDENRADFCMTGVNKINQLDVNPRLYKQQRREARFINTGILASLDGAVASDGLEDGRVISGVGGQYNFVSMAHQLKNGRSILMIKSCREKGSNTTSNIVNRYGHCTIPRHLRDIVITEYGIAELRSQRDSDVIKALLNITDSRFQGDLLEDAKRRGKVEASYAIPEAHRHNTPEKLAEKLAPFQGDGLLPAFPFGTDLTEEEITLADALKTVKKLADATPKWKLLWLGLQPVEVSETARPLLERLGLDAPDDLEGKVTRRLLLKVLGDND